MSKPKKLYNIYFDYSQWGKPELGKVYQGTTDNLNAWLEEGNKLIRAENGFMQEETLEDYIIEEVKA